MRLRKPHQRLFGCGPVCLVATCCLPCRSPPTLNAEIPSHTRRSTRGAQDVLMLRERTLSKQLGFRKIFIEAADRCCGALGQDFEAAVWIIGEQRTSARGGNPHSRADDASHPNRVAQPPRRARRLRIAVPLMRRIVLFIFQTWRGHCCLAVGVCFI
jgi:hypothetical protein